MASGVDSYDSGWQKGIWDFAIISSDAGGDKYVMYGPIDYRYCLDYGTITMEFFNCTAYEQYSNHMINNVILKNNQYISQKIKKIEIQTQYYWYQNNETFTFSSSNTKTKTKNKLKNQNKNKKKNKKKNNFYPSSIQVYKHNHNANNNKTGKISKKKAKKQKEIYELALLMDSNRKYRKILTGPITYEVYYRNIHFIEYQPYLKGDINMLRKYGNCVKKIEANKFFHLTKNYNNKAPVHARSSSEINFSTKLRKVELWNLAEKQLWDNYKNDQREEKYDVILVTNNQKKIKYILNNVVMNCIEEIIKFNEYELYLAGDHTKLNEIADKIKGFGVSKYIFWYDKYNKHQFVRKTLFDQELAATSHFVFPNNMKPFKAFFYKFKSYKLKKKWIKYKKLGLWEVNVCLDDYNNKHFLPKQKSKKKKKKKVKNNDKNDKVMDTDDTIWRDMKSIFSNESKAAPAPAVPAVVALDMPVLVKDQSDISDLSKLELNKPDNVILPGSGLNNYSFKALSEKKHKIQLNKHNDDMVPPPAAYSNIIQSKSAVPHKVPPIKQFQPPAPVPILVPSDDHVPIVDDDFVDAYNKKPDIITPNKSVSIGIYSNNDDEKMIYNTKDKMLSLDLDDIIPLGFANGIHVANRNRNSVINSIANITPVTCFSQEEKCFIPVNKDNDKPIVPIINEQNSIEFDINNISSSINNKDKEKKVYATMNNININNYYNATKAKKHLRAATYTSSEVIKKCNPLIEPVFANNESNNAITPSTCYSIEEKQLIPDDNGNVPLDVDVVVSTIIPKPAPTPPPAPAIVDKPKHIQHKQQMNVINPIKNKTNNGNNKKKKHARRATQDKINQLKLNRGSIDVKKKLHKPLPALPSVALVPSAIHTLAPITFVTNNKKHKLKQLSLSAVPNNIKKPKNNKHYSAKTAHIVPIGGVNKNNKNKCKPKKIQTKQVLPQSKKIIKKDIKPIKKIKRTKTPKAPKTPKYSKNKKKKKDKNNDDNNNSKHKIERKESPIILADSVEEEMEIDIEEKEIWDLYIEKYDHEPKKIDQLIHFSRSDKNIQSLRYKDAKEMFKRRKNKTMR